MRSIGFVAFLDGHPHRPVQRRGTGREESKPLVCYLSKATATQNTHLTDIREVFVKETDDAAS